jgi:AcrR family transcriptional regulator
MADHRRNANRMSRPSRESRRPYRLRARADGQALTRRRITEAAVELHGSIGPARTTIRAIADRAGVERLTVYRHFPDERALYTACSSHFIEEHPPPDLAAPIAVADPATRLEGVLLALYGYYRQTEPMMSALLRDAPSVPLVADYLGPYVAMLHELADQLAAGWRDAREPRLPRAAIGHALAFSTWRSLCLDQNLTDAEAAAIMAIVVGEAAGGTRG